MKRTCNLAMNRRAASAQNSAERSLRRLLPAFDEMVASPTKCEKKRTDPRDKTQKKAKAYCKLPRCGIARIPFPDQNEDSFLKRLSSATEAGSDGESRRQAWQVGFHRPSAAAGALGVSAVQIFQVARETKSPVQATPLCMAELREGPNGINRASKGDRISSWLSVRF